MSYYGDIRLGDTIDIKFTTRQISGAPSTLSSSPVISAYVGNGTTEITAGITLTVDFDSRTGLNNVRVVATSGNGFATATNVQLVITTGTVNSVSVVGEVIGSFSIECRSAVMPTTATRTLTVDASGRALADVDTIKTNPVVNGGTATFPTNATLASTTNITAAAGCAVSSIGNNVITAASAAADFGAEMATAVWTDTTAGDFTVAASVGKSVMNGVALGTGLTVAAVSGAVGSVTGAVGSVTGNVGGNVTGSVGSVVGAVGSVTGAVGSVTAAVTVGTNNDKTGYALTSAEENAIADALLARNVAGGSSAGRLVKEALYVLRNKTNIAAGTLTVYGTDDATPAFTAAVTTTAGDPISQIDPA